LKYKPDTTAYTKKFLDLKPDMAILAGYAGLELISQYDIGVVGVMPSCSFTEVYVDMHAKYMSGDFAGARAIYDKLSKYISEWLVSTQSLLTVEKEILKRRELISCSYCRLPDYKLTKVNYAQIDQFMAEFAKYLT
jgi:4-hydroxy-tetrahydrodipicolinate synthase